MNRIEEVKKIFEKVEFDGGLIELDNEDETIRQICQLFEPKPSGRLLTQEETEQAARDGNSKVPAYGSGAAEHRHAEWQAIKEAQDAKTASIKDAEIGALIEAEKKRIEQELKVAWNEESVRARNQTSTTLPIWVRAALGKDISDMRTHNLKATHTSKGEE